MWTCIDLFIIAKPCVQGNAQDVSVFVRRRGILSLEVAKLFSAI